MNTLETAGSGRWNQPVGRPPVVDAGEKQVSFEVGPPVANLPFQADYAEADVANGRDLTVLAETPRGIDGRQPEFPLNGHEESGMGNWNPPIEQRRMMHLPEQNALFETGSPATASPREAGHSESRIENRSDLAVLRDMPQPVATLRGLPPGATDEKSNLRNWDRPIYGDHTADSWQGLASFESNPSVSNPAPQSPITESYWESPRWYSENPSDLSVLGDLR